MAVSSPCRHHEHHDLRVQRTLDAVHWEALSEHACRLYGAISAKWCAHLSGGYNIVRFLQLDDPNSTTIVARVPYRPENGWNIIQSRALSRQISSEVATMRYIEARTNIPVPHVLKYNPEVDGGGIGSPYILMTKVGGVPLSAVWDDMENGLRTIVLQQVIDILLELSSHRFNKIGSLMQRERDSDTVSPEDEWFIDRPVPYGDLDETIVRAISTYPFTSGSDYWLAYLNAKLKIAHDLPFANQAKIFEYAQLWFVRSLIPALYDPSLDRKGFPLLPGDFHSQNIMVTDTDSHPRITALIDWEFSSTVATSSFAQYPLFIMDHPHWDDDNPLRVRNDRDRTTFDNLLREAESHTPPTGAPKLAPLFASSQGVYLFEQVTQFPWVADILYKQLFEHVYGPDEADFSVDYYESLMGTGILRDVAKRFEQELEAFNDATKVLGQELVPSTFGRSAFTAVVRAHIELFEADSSARRWLATCTEDGVDKTGA